MNDTTSANSSRIEAIIEAALAKQAKYGSWALETSLTNAWMVELNAAGVTRPNTDESAVMFNCHEFHGARETAHGDIGILVKLTMPDGRSVKGFTAIEAKRSQNTGEKYSELKFDQLERHLKHTAHHHVLLYSKQSVMLPSGGTAVHAVLVPTRLVLALQDKTAILENAGIRFGAQLERMFLGHDLDFSKDTVAAVLNGKKPYRSLLTAHFSYSKDSPDDGDMVPSSNCYRKLTKATLAQSSYSKATTERHIRIGEQPGDSVSLLPDPKSARRGGPSR